MRRCIDQDFDVGSSSVRILGSGGTLAGQTDLSCVGNSIASGRNILHNVAGDELKVHHWTRLAVITSLGKSRLAHHHAETVGWLWNHFQIKNTANALRI